MAESEEELKSLLMKVKEESETVGFKLSIQKTKIMASWSHHFMSNRWENSGDSDRLLFSWAPKSLEMVTAAMKLKNTCPWKKVISNLDSTLKSRDITLPTKVLLVKTIVFPVVM